MNVAAAKSQAGDTKPAEPGAILVMGGTSDIGLAIAAELLARQARPVVLAARLQSPHLSSAVAAMESAGATSVQTVDFDACDTASHPAVMERCFAMGSVGTAIVAFGILGDAKQLWHNQSLVVEAASVNFTAALSVGVLLGQALREQGAGQIVAVSSMAGEKVRPSNFVYGSTKAGMDAFYLNLGEALDRFGVQVLVVRPGFVNSKMTHGRKNLLSVSTRTVAVKTVQALDARRRVVRVPAVFGPLMGIYRHLPRTLARRMTF